MNNNGKGSKPRNNFSKKFRDNFDEIQWGRKTVEQQIFEILKPQLDKEFDDAFKKVLKKELTKNQVPDRVGI